ncbi:uncharacterized protein TNCV_4835851 [Trichonephila clavipes]|nr:uncharacterized protein TNCV_4835851 [Trichonephila clavipes]
MVIRWLIQEKWPWQQCGYGRVWPTLFVLSREFESRSRSVVAEWSRYQIVAGLVTSSSPVPPKTHRVREQCTLNLSRAQTSSRWCGVVVRRGVVHVT